MSGGLKLPIRGGMPALLTDRPCVGPPTAQSADTTSKSPPGCSGQRADRTVGTGGQSQAGRGCSGGRTQLPGWQSCEATVTSQSWPPVTPPTAQRNVGRGTVGVAEAVRMV